VTPGGQAILNLVDFFGGGFIIFALGLFNHLSFLEKYTWPVWHRVQPIKFFVSVSAIIEVLALAWVYGMNRFCRYERNA
jgi:hypothetical protein